MKGSLSLFFSSLLLTLSFVSCSGGSSGSSDAQGTQALNEAGLQGFWRLSAVANPENLDEEYSVESLDVGPESDMKEIGIYIRGDKMIALIPYKNPDITEGYQMQLEDLVATFSLDNNTISTKGPGADQKTTLEILRFNGNKLYVMDQEIEEVVFVYERMSKEAIKSKLGMADEFDALIEEIEQKYPLQSGSGAGVENRTEDEDEDDSFVTYIKNSIQGVWVYDTETDFELPEINALGDTSLEGYQARINKQLNQTREGLHSSGSNLNHAQIIVSIEESQITIIKKWELPKSQGPSKIESDFKIVSNSSQGTILFINKYSGLYLTLHSFGAIVEGDPFYPRLVISGSVIGERATSEGYEKTVPFRKISKEEARIRYNISL